MTMAKIQMFGLIRFEKLKLLSSSLSYNSKMRPMLENDQWMPQWGLNNRIRPKQVKNSNIWLKKIKKLFKEDFFINFIKVIILMHQF